MAVREVGRDGDPLPALAAQVLGCGLELLSDHTVEQHRILEPAATVLVEQIAGNDATSRFIGFDTDKLRPLVGRLDGAFGEKPADGVRLLIEALRQAIPDLLLPRMVVGDGEGHELLERHAVLGIDVEEPFGDRRKAKPLLDGRRRDEETCGDFFLAESLCAQRLKAAELIERMQIHPLNILGKGIFLGGGIAALAQHAGNGRGLGHALLLDQGFQRAVAATARGNLEHAGLDAVRVEHRPDVEALKQTAMGDVFARAPRSRGPLSPAGHWTGDKTSLLKGIS